jgi:excisionase family DNA binding protein
MTEQVLFSLPLERLEPIFKKWVKAAIGEMEHNPQPPGDELLNIEQAADFLSLTKPTIYSMVSRGELPSMKRSKRLYFFREDLISYVKKGRRKSNKEIEADAEKYLVKKGRKKS